MEQRVSDEALEQRLYTAGLTPREREGLLDLRDARAEIARLVKTLDLVEICYSLEAARNIAHATLALRPQPAEKAPGPIHAAIDSIPTVPKNQEYATCEIPVDSVRLLWWENYLRGSVGWLARIEERDVQLLAAVVAAGVAHHQKIQARQLEKPA